MPNMTQNHLATIAFRGSILAVFALWAFAPRAHAQPVQAAKVTSISGVYNGSYAGAQGPIKFKLSITQQDNKNKVLAGSCTLYLQEWDGTKEYTCDVRGVYIPANRMVDVFRGKWETPPPASVDMPGMTGLFDPEGGNGAGQIAGTVLVRHGPQFQAVRDADESAKMVAAVAAKKEAGPPATPVAPPARRPAAANRAAPGPASPPAPARAPGPDANSPAAINGVYNGTYAGQQGPIKFKLSVTLDNGTLAGVFTLYLPEGSGTKSYTCDLTGRLGGNNRAFVLRPVRGVTPPPAGVYVPGMVGVFDPAGGNGAGQISGKLQGYPGPQFEAIRDATESAKMAAAAKKEAGPTAINGVYTGEFKSRDLTGDFTSKLKFSIKSTDDGSLTGLFTFELPRKPGSFITYKLTGKYVAGATEYAVGSSPFQFTTIEPVGSAAQDVLSASKAQAVHVGINGPGSIVGTVTGGSGREQLSATRDRTESADLDKVMAAQASAGSSAVPAAAVVRSSFDGVYNGTVTGKEGPTKFKLTLWTQSESRGTGGELVSSNIAGLLTLNLPEGSDTKAYTCELRGIYTLSQNAYSQNFQLNIKRWEAPPPSNITGSGLAFKFDPDGGGHGVGQISGRTLLDANSKFLAIRDAAESANMPNMRLANNIRPGIQGVFNGTYTREKGPPTKFKLTIFRKQEAITSISSPGARPMEQIIKGLATIYLPVDSGTKACTYDLEGVETRDGQFQLKVHEWVTIPPKDFENFRSMGFDGILVLDLTKNTARIVSHASMQASHSPTPEYLPQFEATWDATESVDFRGAMAAQKAVGGADWDAALKVHYDTVKNAPPKELASKDLVRKSRAYWEDYQTDMLREVFDGGFGPGIDEDEQFQRVFLTYVGTFSVKCPECLPPNHQTVTVTEITSMTVTENRGWQPGQPEADRYRTNKTEKTYAVEMDPRFVAKFNQLRAAVNSPGAGLRGLAAIAQPGGVQSVLHDRLAMVNDMQKFFADHAGKSAAMRQLTENFLRAVNGEPSLQQSGGKIDGAEAESDKDVLPGRYARFVDGANAFYRDPANAKYKGRNDTAFCQGLAVPYQVKMTPDEQYYYANDFKARFLDQIMQKHWENCSDPEWPVFHPAVEAFTAKPEEEKAATGRALMQRYTADLSRCMQATRGMNQLAQKQAGQGIQLPTDVSDACDRLNKERQAVVGAMQNRDNDQEEKCLQSLEDTVTLIEKYLKEKN
jgi:hypothetical protein